jgi:OFA family oxalate/formate antiporter-like MFS transporter
MIRGRKVFYGWFIVAAALFAQFTASAIQSNSQTVFLKPMTTELGWSRADFTWGQTFGTFIMSGAGFFVGNFLDAKGPRPFMLAGAVCLSASVLAMSQVDSLWQYLVLRGIGITLGAIMIGNLVVNTTVSKWFVRRRAWAIAAATTGLSLSGAITPRITAALLEAYGWRTSWVILAFAMLVLVVPSALVMRRRPEDHGLLPDGDEAAVPTPTGTTLVTAATEVQWTRAEAVHTRSFWLLVLSFCLASFGAGAFSLHTVSYLEDSGYSTGEAAARFSTAFLFTAMSRPFWGSVMQRFAPRYCASLGFLTTAACTAGIIFSLGSGSSTLLYVFMIGWGVGFGGYVPIQELIWATYFGRQHIGKVRSVAIPILGVTSAIGPQLAARVYDAAGSYKYAFVLFASSSAIGAVCILWARPPRRSVTAELGRSLASSARRFRYCASMSGHP